MKIIARGKEDGWYIVSGITGYPQNLKNPVYIGDGEKGVITSMANVSKRYWNEDELEDLRDKNVPIPEEVKAHINQLIADKKKRA